jgi:hypothetical protein
MRECRENDTHARVVANLAHGELYMPNDWIIDVLADLKAFANLNGLTATAAQLEDASLVALAELSSPPPRSRDGVQGMAGGHERETGTVTRQPAGRSHA